MRLPTDQLWGFTSASELAGFAASSCSGALWSREVPGGSDALFDSVLSDLSQFRKVLAPEQVSHALAQAFPARFWRDPLSVFWLGDVTALCTVFCAEIGTRQCFVQLDRDRPCVRYHADNVNLRMVCAYRGAGTCWLTDDNLDPAQLERRGSSNEELVLRPQDVRQNGQWEVLVMKGRQSNANPFYHKSPEVRPGDPLSLVLKLDAPEMAQRD